MLAAVRVHLVRREGGRDVKLARAKGAFLRVDALDGIEIDPVEQDFVAVPVGGTFLDADDLVGFPLLEDEGTVADVGFRPGPAAAPLLDADVCRRGGFFNRLPRNGEPGMMPDEREEIGGGRVQGDLEGQAVKGLDADGA